MGLALLWLLGFGTVIFHTPYLRLQVAGVGDIGGATLFFLGLILHARWEATGGLILVMVLFLPFTGPLATPAAAKSAFVRRIRD